MSLKRRLPFLRWSFWRMAAASARINKTGQIGDGREAAVVEYVLAEARHGDVTDVLAAIDRFAYEKSFLINVGDEKGRFWTARSDGFGLSAFSSWGHTAATVHFERPA